MLRLGLLLLILPSLALMAVYFIDQSAIEACLAEGGSFNYAADECDFTNKHPYQPLMARHPTLINSAMLVSIVGLFMCLKGLLWRPR